MTATDAVPTQHLYEQLFNRLFERAAATFGGVVCAELHCAAEMPRKRLNPRARLVFANAVRLSESLEAALNEMRRVFCDVAPRDARARVLFSPLRCVWTRASGLVLLYEYRVIYDETARAALPTKSLCVDDFMDDEARRLMTALLHASAPRA